MAFITWVCAHAFGTLTAMLGLLVHASGGILAGYVTKHFWRNLAEWQSLPQYSLVQPECVHFRADECYCIRRGS